MGNHPTQLIEKKRWYRDIRAIVALIGGVIVIVAAIAKFWPVPQPESRDYFEIVLDSSSRMTDPWRQTSKWATASSALDEFFYMTSEKAYIALRDFGGPCENDDSREQSQLLVPFGTGNRNEILTAYKAKEPSGDATLVRGLVQALDDMKDRRLAQHVETSDMVIAITAGPDCRGAEALEFLRDKYNEEGVKLNFTMIGIALDAEGAAAVGEIADIVGGQMVSVQNEVELSLALVAAQQLVPPGDIEDALKGIGDRLWDGERSVSVNELRELLPKELAGLQRTSYEAELAGFGIKISKANAEYGERDRRLSLMITDLGGASGLAQISGGLFAMGVNRDDKSGFERTTTYKGHKSFQRMQTSGDQSIGEIMVFVDDRFAVQLDGQNVPFKQIIESMDQIDLQALSALKLP